MADGGGVLVRVGKKPADPLCAVVVVDVAGVPDITNLPIFQKPHGGSVVLEAGDAYLDGAGVRFEEDEGHRDLLMRNNTDRGFHWNFELRKGGEFNLQITYACADNQAGSQFILEIRNNIDDTVVATRSVEISSTGGDDTFTTISLGNVPLPDPGRYTLRLIPKAIKHNFMMRVRSIEMKPSS